MSKVEKLLSSVNAGADLGMDRLKVSQTSGAVNKQKKVLLELDDS